MDNKEVNEKIEELRVLESQIQNFLAHKQTAQIELNELDNALKELRKTDDSVYKIVSGIMVKSEKEKLIRELEEKKKLIEAKINSVEKQEKILEKDSLELRKEINEKVTKTPATSKK